MFYYRDLNENRFPLTLHQSITRVTTIGEREVLSKRMKGISIPLV